MIKYSNSIEIKAPVSEVFAFISNLENIPKWQSEVVNSKIISPGPLQTGTRFEEVVKVFGKKMPTVCEITDYQPTKRFGFRSDSANMISYNGHFQFEPVGRGTKLTVNAVFSLKGFWKIMEPFFGFEVRKGIGHELKTIKTILENSKS
jgi:uncharacterized membrane protein